MDENENPTPEPGGASIADRLIERLTAPEPSNPEPKAQEAQAKEPAQGASDDAQGGDPEQSEQPQITTSDLAKLLDIDESALDVGEDGKVFIKSKIDGKEGTAKFAELLKTYQLSGHAENTARAAAEAKKAADTRMQEVEQAAQARMQQVEGLATVAQQELMREYQSIDWQALRQADPGQYAAMQQDFQGRHGKLQGVFQQLHQQRQQQAHQQEQVYATYLAQEAEKLPTLIPEWKNAEVANRERGEIVDWCQKQGYTPEQIQSLSRSSALQVATIRRAMLFDKLQQSKPQIENKVRTAPKIVKPGQAVQDGSQQKLRDLKQKVRSSGGKGGSVAEFLIAAGKV